jgi:hypothetical protein
MGQHLAVSHFAGWMTTEFFPSVLMHIKKHVNCSKEIPILLIMDNHTTHISLEAINYIRENGIVLVLLSLPPHSSHRMQPLDISVYGPFKARCKATLTIRYMSNNAGKAIRIQDIPRITKDPYFYLLYQQISQKDLIQQGYGH